MELTPLQKTSAFRKQILLWTTGFFLILALFVNIQDFSFVSRYRFVIKKQGDMQYYYYGGLMLRSGNPHIYDKAQFDAFYTGFPEVQDHHHMLNYPPLIYCLFSLVSGSFLPMPLTGNIWFILNILMLLVSVVIIFYALSPLQNQNKGRIARFTVFGLFSIIFAPVMDSLLQGQVNILLLLLISGALLFTIKKKYAYAGILIGIAASIKLFPVFFLLYYAVKKKWQTIWVCFLTGVLIHVFIILIFGLPLITGYLQNTSGTYRIFLQEFIHENISPLASLSVLFEPGPVTFNLFNAPYLTTPVRIVWLLVMMGLPVLLIMFTGKKLKNSNITEQDESYQDLVFFPLFMSSLIVINPLVWGHHLPLLILPLLIYFELLLDTDNLDRSLYICGLILLCSYLTMMVFCGYVTPIYRREFLAMIRFYFMGSAIARILLVTGFLSLMAAGFQLIKKVYKFS